MRRLLCIVGSMDMGGAETFLMKVYRSIDKSKYQMDFCVSKQKKGFYDDEIRKMGGNIYRVTPKTKGALKNFKDIKRIVKDNNYNNVLRISQNSLSSLELLAARMGGAKNLIFRSSNSSACGGRKEEIIHYIFRPFANCISNKKIAPSKEAGDFMFGHAKYTIVSNGLPIDDYRFSEAERRKYRELFNTRDKTMVVGHVGRFNKQKNHKFLIDVFDKFHEMNPDSELWLIGNGEMEREIREYVNGKLIDKNVKFLGARSDVNGIYSAMDCFVFPSLYEGMPNTVIEAQVSGLPCLVADAVTKDCKITSNLIFLPLGSNYLRDWVTNITKKDRPEHVGANVIDNYDISTVARVFTEICFCA